MKRKSYFRKVLLNFMITLCVPIITILLLYMHAESKVREQIYMSGENALNQYYAAVDTIVEEMGNLCLAMALEDQCQKYVTYANYYPQKAAYQAVVVSNALSLFWEERYLDIFVYYPYQDRIISAQYATGTSWHYFNSYYDNTTVKGKSSEEWESFQNIINCDSASPVFSTIQKDGKTYLCAASKQWKYQGEKNNYTVVAVLNADFLEKLMGIDRMNADVTMMMFDNKKEAILATQEELLEDCSLEGYVPGQNRYQTEINGQEYMLYVRRSDNLNGYYTIAVPFDSFWESLVRLRTTTGLGIVFSIVCSVLIALQGGIRSWKPIEKTIKRLTNDMEHHEINADNELEYIELMFQRESEKNQMLRDKMKMGERLQQEKQLMALLDGSAGAGGVDFRYEAFCVCSITSEKNESLDAGMLSFIMRNVWEELCSQIGSGYVVTFSENKVVLLINCPADREEEILWKLLQEGKEFIEKYYQVTLTLGISDVQIGSEAISGAYEEAEKALDYRYLEGNGRMIAYQDIKCRAFQYESFEGKNLSALLMEYVHNKKQSRSPAEFINEMFALYGIHQGISLDTMECFRFEVLNAVHHVMLSCQYAQEQKKENLESLLLTSNMEAFRECLIALLDELCHENQRREQQRDICVQAKACIEERYGDSGLSLELLGEEIGCSPAYLSRKFKEKYGVSVLECITDERIRNARQLLEETSYSVQEISEMTGYLSSSTFVKIFKKKVGVPPGAYRDIHKEKEG